MKNIFIDSLRLHVKGGHGGNNHYDFNWFDELNVYQKSLLIIGNGYPKYGGIGGQGKCP